MHQAHFSFDHYIVTGPFAIWSSLSVAGDASVDKPGVDVVDALEVHLVLLERVWQVILHQNIAVLGQFVKDLLPWSFREGQSYGFLVSINLSKKSVKGHNQAERVLLTERK